MTDPSDIVERLHKIADASRRPDGTDIPLGEELRAAANEIEQLRASSELNKIIESAKLASRITQEHDEIGISIYLRSYGFLVESRREKGDNLIRKSTIVLFDDLNRDGNPLTEAIERLLQRG